MNRGSIIISIIITFTNPTEPNELSGSKTPEISSDAYRICTVLTESEMKGDK